MLKIDMIEQFFYNILMTLLIAILFFQVASRFLFHTGMAASEEYSRFLFIVMALWSTSYMAKIRGHIRITAFIGLFPDKIRTFLIAISDITFFIFNCVVIYYGIVFTRQNIVFPRISPVSGINMAFLYAFIPITFTTTNIRIILNWISGNIAIGEREIEEVEEIIKDTVKKMDKEDIKKISKK
jgi:TRAP-type C4-dicarboxylate transport system permease small subunit